MSTAIRRASSFVSSLAADSSPRLFFKIDIAKLLPAVIAHDEARFQFLDRPRRREAAWRHAPIISSALRISD
jgi:hypothetical protein